MAATIACLMMTGEPALARLGSTIATTLDSSPGRVIRHAKNGELSFDETTDSNGITLRQYVDSAGVVYAVSWHGAAMPDLDALLGAHFARYKSAAAGSQASHGLHASRVADDDLVVESGVRLRQFVGRAWLTDALPAGVTADDIE
ncbi:MULTISPECIES: DUF2844 domain-containing protein [unclassified Caballeronia]|uniref:DUF2844 domain-containing protein n=1 Tax=unclassified Caballeronia TaxID=2646786 RepID=UPI0028542235|nr:MULTISPECIES: DUF2844 domain-containing protein [unclassified Caballeronia]MDR5750927.1 DUF2844 domain-containing protein [Caballeronia sp. LZ024]MDR5842041.1 DUF2844 domain-containing protein [Caballeronia sp. LZ031]